MIFTHFFRKFSKCFFFDIHANAFHYIDYGQWNFNSSLSFSLCLSILFLSPLVSVFNFAISGTLFAKICGIRKTQRIEEFQNKKWFCRAESDWIADHNLSVYKNALRVKKSISLILFVLRLV